MEYARFLGLLRAAPGLFVTELVDTLRIVVTKNVEFLNKSQSMLTHEISQLTMYSSEPQNLQEQCPPDADGGNITTTPVVHADSSVGLWEPCFSAPRAKNIIHANEIYPIAYANATGEYKQRLAAHAAVIEAASPQFKHCKT